MIKEVTKVSEVVIDVPNQVGVLAKLTEALSGEGVNILALTAETMEDTARLRVVTTDSGKTIKVASALGWEVIARDVLQVVLENKIGAAQAVSSVLASEGINIDAVYGSTWDNASAIVVVPSDIARAISILKEATA